MGMSVLFKKLVVTEYLTFFMVLYMRKTKKIRVCELQHFPNPQFSRLFKKEEHWTAQHCNGYHMFVTWERSGTNIEVWNADTGSIMVALKTSHYPSIFRLELEFCQLPAISRTKNQDFVLCCKRRWVLRPPSHVQVLHLYPV